MWKQRALSIEAAGAAVLCTILTQHLSSRRSELFSELVCWLILPVLFKVTGGSDPGSADAVLLSSPEAAGTKTTRWSAWIFAACVAVSSNFKTEAGLVRLCPALTPLLLAAQKAFAAESVTLGTANASSSGPAVNTVWVAAPIATFSTLSLLYWDLRESVLLLIPGVALFVIYLALLSGPRRRRFLPRADLEEAIVPVSARTVALIALAVAAQAVLLGQPDVEAAPVVASGLAKALSWYTMAKTARHSSWCIAPTIGTFAIASTRDPFQQSSEAQALTHVVVSILAVCQTIQFLPKQLWGRYALWAFALFSIIPYATNILAIRDARSSAVSSGHPVEGLITNAKADFESLVQRQSKSYAEAHGEYLRRYGVVPPPGFWAWYEFATSRQSPIIDDFDMIFESVSPLWELSGKEIQEVMQEAQDANGNELWVCTTANTTCSHPDRTNDRNFALLFNTLLEDIRGALTEVKYLVNHFDEPAVLLPPRIDNSTKGVKMEGVRKVPLWPRITKHCGNQADDESTTVPDTFGLPFLTNISSSKDLCRHPEYRRIHGLLNRPKSAQLIRGAVPVLSTGSFSTMGDIMFPSPAYIEDGFKYDPTYDLEWKDKRNNVYWAGSTTGGYAADDMWRHYQRQRFVEMAQNLGRGKYSYLREVGGEIHRITSSFLNSRLFDVAFTRVNQCKKKYCQEQRNHFRTKAWAHKDEALQSRLVFDVDGNGISGRYYKLLASRSTPLKQTIVREWHDERLVPWVHYVPVSIGMEELPELVAYLTSTETGQERAREIAEAGRKWYFEALRVEDLSVYVYRLMLELARLQDPEREARTPRPSAGKPT